MHDTTLQVLAFVRRRGAEIGGPTTELATLAGDQEDALRKLLSRQAGASRADQAAPKDLRSRLEQELPTDVSIAAPSHPMVLPEAVTNEIVAVVRAAVDNTQKHAGPGARSFVLLEDDDAEFVVTVRDDGVGFDPARLAEAEAEDEWASASRFAAG